MGLTNRVIKRSLSPSAIKVTDVDDSRLKSGATASLDHHSHIYHGHQSGFIQLLNEYGTCVGADGGYSRKPSLDFLSRVAGE